MIYEYASVLIIFGSAIYSGLSLIWVKLSRAGIRSVLKRVRFGVEIFESLWFGSLRFEFELGHVISGVGNFGSCYNSGFVQL